MVVKMNMVSYLFSIFQLFRIKTIKQQGQEQV